MDEEPRFLKNFESWEKRRKIAQLFREALEAQNVGNLEATKKRFDEILELSKDELPEIYFECCFRIAEVFFDESNYRGGIKCALKALYNAPTRDHYLLGVTRVRDLLFILKERRKLDVLKENMESILSLLKDDEELYAFTQALIELARGNMERVKEFSKDIRTPELRQVLEMLVGL